MPDIVVQLPSRGISVSFPDDATPEEIQAILDRDYPRDGQDVAYALNTDPAFAKSISDDDFLLYEQFMENKKVDFLNTAATAAGVLGTTIGKGVRGLFDINNLNPARAGATLVESGAQGTRQLYGMLAQSEDPSSVFFKFKDWINGTSTPEERKRQWQEAREFVERSRRLEEGRETVTGIDPRLVNNDVKNALSLIADPTLLIPGLGEVMGAGRLASRAVGVGVEAAGKATSAVARPLVSVIDRVGEVGANLVGTEEKTLRGIAAGTGISGAIMGLPGAATAVGAVGAVEGADVMGRVLQRSGQQLQNMPSRIGALESLALDANAGPLERALAKVGRYGGDVAIDTGLRATAGAMEGAAIGAGLGYLSAGEEGAASGLGSGAVLGATGATIARGIQRATGAAAREARAGDFQRFFDSLDEDNKVRWGRILENSGLDGAVRVMDIAGHLAGKVGDAELRAVTAPEFIAVAGTGARGVQRVEGERPIVYINADHFASDATAGHELFHAYDAIEQLRPEAERIRQAIAGTYVIDRDGKSVLAMPGILPEAEVLKRFDEYKSKVGKAGDRRWQTANTTYEKAQLVSHELAAEYMDKLIRGSSPDIMLRGFDGITRQFLDRTLISAADNALRRIAEKVGIGSNPIESVTFRDLPQATPVLNAMLRDLVRARRTLSERITLAEDTGTVVSRRNMGNPIVAEEAIKLGLAERKSDNTVVWKNEDVLNAEDHARNDELKRVLSSAPVDPDKPHARIVDGQIVGDGISDAQMRAIEASAILPDTLKQAYRIAKKAMDNGDVLFIRNGKATKEITSRLTGKKLKRYNDGVRIIEREIRPYELRFSKAGEPYLRTIDMSKVRTAAMDLAARNRLGPWGGDFKGFYSDFLTYVRNLGDRHSTTQTKDLPGFNAEKANYLHDFFGGKDGSSAKYIRNFTLDRMVEMRPTGEAMPLSDGAFAWDRMKARFQPAEKVGDGEVIKSSEGYNIINKGGKYHLYTPDGRRIIFDTQAQAEAKAERMANSALSLTEWKRRVGPEDRKAIIEAEKKIAEVARENPEAIRLEVQRDANGKPKIELLEDAEGNPILDANGKQRRGVVFTKESYGLRDAPGLSADEARAVQQGADLLEPNARGAMADPAIANGLGWYSRMRSLFQSVFGADIEIFGQLLGATSARTPVDINFRQALEALRLFSSGAYDDLVQKYHQHVTKVKADAASGRLFEEWKKANPKKRDSAFVMADEVRKRINDFDEVPLRSNGAKYNANSKKVLQVLYGNWVAMTQGPKTPNFAGNLTGRTLAATIDVWAARNLRRLLYSGQRTRWRLLPEQESGVDFTINKDGVYGGDFVFAQRIYEETARRLNMNPDDLQALMWFAEKDVWEKNGWTNTVGAEKSSFDKEAGKLATDRFQAGVTTFKDKKTFSKPAHEAARQRLQSTLAKNTDLVAARVTASAGLYDRTIEPSFDVEFSVKRGSVPLDAIAEVIKLGKESDQTDVFISKVVDKEHPNARPGMEIGFKKPASLSDIRLVLRSFREAGIDGFTVARDRRGNVIGIRTQYVPEISGRWDPSHLDFDTVLQRAHEWGKNARKAKEALNTPNISYATETFFSTNVFGRGEYDAPVDGSVLQRDARAELGRRRQLLERERLLREQQAAGSADRGGSQAPRGTDAGQTESSVNFQPAAPDTPEFKRWFANSKVVDKNGKPIVVYHGTPSFEGNEFRPSKAKNRTGNPTGYYFTTEPYEASIYSSGYGEFKEGSQVIPAFLSIKKPYDLSTTNTPLTEPMLSEYRRQLEKSNPHLNSQNSWFENKVQRARDINRISSTALNNDGDAFAAIIKAGGYDGVKDGSHWVAFEPTQIKSAIGNRGTFDPTNPDIRFQPAENLPNGKVWRSVQGFSILQKDGGKFRVYSPIGLIGVSSSLEQAQQLIDKRTPKL